MNAAAPEVLVMTRLSAHLPHPPCAKSQQWHDGELVVCYGRLPTVDTDPLLRRLANRRLGVRHFWLVLYECNFPASAMHVAPQLGCGWRCRRWVLAVLSVQLCRAPLGEPGLCADLSADGLDPSPDMGRGLQNA